MANAADFKKIAEARLSTVDTLIQAEDWDGAAYMMGFVLECALKAATCKTLKLTSYPENTRNKKTDSFFMTHVFDQLLTVSGLADTFSAQGPVSAFRNWSEFTKEYEGEWTAMRYDRDRLAQFDEIKVKHLYNNLKEVPDGVIT